MNNEKVAKSSNKFYCDICDYITCKKTNYEKHLATVKHKLITNNNEKVANATKVAKSSNELYCDICHYRTCKKSNYDKHMSTYKHKIIMNNNEKVSDATKVAKIFGCICGKTYKYSSGISAHKKKCQSKNTINEESSESEIDYKEMFLEMLTQNKELQNTIIEQNKMFQTTITEIIPKLGNNNSHNMNNSNINIVMNNINFLNEKCKDAYIGIISQTTSDINEKMDKIVSNIVDKTHLSDESKDEMQSITE